MTDVLLPGAEQFVLSRADGMGDHLVQIAPPMVGPAASPPAAGFPVVFVLDGAHLFGTAFESLRLRALTSGLPPAVLVGLDYPGALIDGFRRRAFDYTGPIAPEHVAEPAMLGDRFGGARAFLEFILGDVWSAVSERFPVDASGRTLIGHSLGGLFAVNTLFARPEAFSAIGALSPSLWWNGFETLRRSKDAVTCLAGLRKPVSVLLTIGGREQDAPSAAPPGMTLDVFADRVRAWRMVDAMQELAADLGRVGTLVVRACVFEDEDHASVLPAALSRSLTIALGA